MIFTSLGMIEYVLTTCYLDLKYRKYEDEMFQNNKALEYNHSN